jgi:light-regulated signal transduction histidine kinase (bacteriophytochrome)/CheY-like chemotaxis protein
MSLDNSIDLTNCDREPIHIPGSIQPHGCLIACDISAVTVLRHSANAPKLLGIPGDANGQPLEAILGEQAAHTIRNALSRTSDPARPALIFSLRLLSGNAFNIAVHRFKSTAIVEFEADDAPLIQPLEMARAMIGRITAIEDTDTLVRTTARLIRALLGYDRVMVYQFGQDGSGKVTSESRRPDLESFLGQYFPASDIPQQARALYLRNTIRIISDANFERIPIVPALDASGEPLDLSFAHLRSVSPIHCEYLRNMGVGASMSISIIVDGALWGLIACHHYEPKTLAMAERVAAEIFGEFFSLHLNALKQKNKLEAATQARQSLDRFLRLAAREGDIENAVRGNLPDFASLIPCDGAGVWLNGKWTSIGTTPPEAAIPGLAGLAGTMTEGKIWATHMLSNFLPDAEDYAAASSGVMIVPLSQRPRDYLLFFRKELEQTLEWAGNPEKSYETGPLGDRLTPRKSFAIWKEIVHRQAEPWSDEDREIAEATRAALVEVVLRHSELLEDERAKADVRQRMLNEELNHRVKNILAVIKSLVSHRSHEGEDLESYVTSLRGRIHALAFAHDQVVRGDGGGNLAELINAELTPYRDRGSTILIEGAPAWLDARAFSVMALVLHELSTNAAKYGALSRSGASLSVRWKFDDTAACEIDWQESGGPAVKPPSRRGFGTVLIDRSIPFDLGGDSDVQYRPDGFAAKFRIPARHVSRGAATANLQPHKSKTPAANDSGTDLSGARVLIVEDQMLIAMDLEEMLTAGGVGEVVSAGSATEALDKLRNFAPAAAVLDVNLGTETSVPVAEELMQRGIPFMFATGYGDRAIIPEKFRSAPIVRKPYEAASIVSQLSHLLKKT